MLDPAGPNADQIAHWNSQAGQAWVTQQDRLDRQLAPLSAATAHRLGLTAGARVIDIGCGCGGSTLQMAERVGPGGEAFGLDISEAMLAVARRRAADEGVTAARFLQADAQTYPFETGAYDAAFSRFGVMFFADPVAAFANVRRALRPGGRIAFVCWRSPAENPIMTLPMDAAAPFLPEPPPGPKVGPGARGPFAFADRTTAETILADAGFADIAAVPHDEMLTAGNLEDAVETALGIGPLSSVLRTNPGLRAEVEPAIRAALQPHDSPRGVYLRSATWIFTARNP